MARVSHCAAQPRQNVAGSDSTAGQNNAIPQPPWLTKNCPELLTRLSIV